MDDYTEIARAVEQDYSKELIKHEQQALSKAFRRAVQLGLDKHSAYKLAKQMMQERHTLLLKHLDWLQ